MIFLNFILTSTFNCGTISQYPYCHSYATEYAFNGSYDLKLTIATEMLETVDWNEETQAKARQYLYDLLMQDTVLANSNSAFLDFIAEYEGWLQSVYEVSDELRNIEQYDSLFTGLIRDTDSLIQFYSDSITKIYDEGREEELAQTIEDFYYQINFLEQTKGNLISQRQAFVDGELGEIQNEYVVSPELPAQNTQTINGIYIDFLESGDNYDVFINNYSVLFAIANQCPAAGGQSVYRARAMIAFLNDSLEYNDAIVCLQSGIYRELITESIIPKFEIMPNPAQDLIEIVLSDKLEGLCTFKIINAFGQTIIQRKMDCSLKSHIIDISSIVQGAYIIKLEFSNLTYDNQKLIIVR